MQQRDEPRWLLKAIRETTSELESNLWRLEHELARRRVSGQWSPAAVACHLRDCEERFVRRLRAVAARDEAPIEAFDPDGTDFPEAPGEDLVSLLDQFSRLRHQTLDLLWMLDPVDWYRCGRHPYLGAVPLRTLVREIHEHDLAHLWEVRRMLETGAGGPS